MRIPGPLVLEVESDGELFTIALDHLLAPEVSWTVILAFFCFEAKLPLSFLESKLTSAHHQVNPWSPLALSLVLCRMWG